jgi:hypothetical protein
MAANSRHRPGAAADEPRDPYAAEGTTPAADSVAAALARARRHGKAAAAETIAAARALIEAASLATRGQPSEASRLLGPLAKLLEHLGDELGVDGTGATPRILAGVAAAVDDEIRRWQARSSDDAEARAVLRAFLGLREVLWEMGVRSGAGPSARAPREDTQPRPDRRGASPTRHRIQRVPVEG